MSSNQPGPASEEQQYFLPDDAELVGLDIESPIGLMESIRALQIEVRQIKFTGSQSENNQILLSFATQAKSLVITARANMQITSLDPDVDPASDYCTKQICIIAANNLARTVRHMTTQAKRAGFIGWQDARTIKQSINNVLGIRGAFERWDTYWEGGITKRIDSLQQVVHMKRKRRLEEEG